jgi:hypothetical protein
MLVVLELGFELLLLHPRVKLFPTAMQSLCLADTLLKVEEAAEIHDSQAFIIRWEVELPQIRLSAGPHASLQTLRKKTISNKCALYQRLCHGHCDPVQPASM